ncbi:hypothetical protein DL766_001700 [Monosporascus sp. MC13-8B]|nr:hypothetical protein DL763_009354 [Monosporascus cannonballus]RYP37026.1 hypothetical protein DL766_001700 [Monosporascus sp. MC13-8B]
MAMETCSSVRQSEPQEVWTQVRRKSRRNAGSKAPQQQLKAPLQKPTGSGTTTRLSVSEIQRDHERFSMQWQESSCRRQLLDLMASRTGRPTTTVSQAVCLGIGSFDPKDGAWEVKRRAHVQLAAFLSIVGELGGGGGGGGGAQQQQQPIRCYFQEPLFTLADEAFIKGMGHEVLGSPSGFEVVDRDTLVFGVHLYRDVYGQAIAKCVPAIFVGTGLDVWEGSAGA